MPSAERPRINPADYDDVEIDDPDNPEWTGADFAKAGPKARLPSEAHTSLTQKRDQMPNLMALSPMTYRVFVAGACDVSGDMEVVKQVLYECSLVSQACGVKFEAFDWHEVSPGIGSEPQAVIIEHAGDYNACIALVGSKVGTPTRNYASGTFEEVYRAIDKVPAMSFGGHSMMLFFRNKEVNLGDVDVESLVKIRELKSKVAERGLFYKDYRGAEELRESIFRAAGVFLSVHVRKRLGELPAIIQIPADEGHASADIVQDSVEDELGVFDYQDVIDFEINRSTSSMVNITEAVTRMTEGLNASRQRIEAANSIDDQVAVRKSINEAADIMRRTAAVIARESPVVSLAFNAALDASERIIEIQALDFGEDAAEATKARTINAFLELRPNVVIARDATLANIATQRSLARTTKEFNLAKRNLLSANGGLVEAYDQVLAKIDEQMLRLKSVSSKSNMA